MTTQPSSSVFWYFVLAAALFVGSRSLFPQASGGCCLSGRCPVPAATVPQVDDTLTNEQVAQKQ